MSLRLKRPDRFWEKVERKDLSGCWLWTGALRKDTGYGHHSEAKRAMLAHRVSYELTFGEIPLGMWVLHTCDVKRCVNPEHLYLGTVHDNGRDASVRLRVRRGSDVYGARLTVDDIQAIRRLRQRGVTLFSIAQAYGVTEANVSLIVRGRTWKWVPSCV